MVPKTDMIFIVVLFLPKGYGLNVRYCTNRKTEAFKVLGEKRGYTESHQTVVNVLDYGDGGTIEADLEKANIIVNRQLIPGDLKAGRHYMHPGGIRLGTSEITRLGMKESEMKEIASLLKQVVVDKKDAGEIAARVKEFKTDFKKTQYCFDNKLGAYEYVKLR